MAIAIEERYLAAPPVPWYLNDLSVPLLLCRFNAHLVRNHSWLVLKIYSRRIATGELGPLDTFGFLCLTWFVQGKKETSWGRSCTVNFNSSASGIFWLQKDDKNIASRSLHSCGCLVEEVQAFQPSFLGERELTWLNLKVQILLYQQGQRGECVLFAITFSNCC